MSDKIGFVQIAKITGINGNTYVMPEEKNNVRYRLTQSNWAIDRMSPRNSGWYGVADDGTNNNTVQFGYFKSDGSNKRAVLNDTPRRRKPDVNEKWEYQTYAIAMEGPNKGKIFAGLYWRFEVDNDGKVTSLPLANINSASQDFQDAVNAWNLQAKGATNRRNGTNQEQLGPFH